MSVSTPPGAQPASLPPDTPRSACPEAGDCAGAALCRFAAPARQKPHIHVMPRGERLAIPGGQLCFHAVRAGLSGACAATPQGRRQILCLTGAGELICPLVGRDGNVWIEALAPARLCEIDLEPERERLSGDARFGAQLLTLAQGWITGASAHLLALGRMSGTERLRSFLADQFRRFGEPGGNRGGRLTLPMSREDIADHLGLTPETVCRLLAGLRKEGLVRSLSPTRIELPDAGALTAPPNRQTAGTGLLGGPGIDPARA